MCARLDPGRKNDAAPAVSRAEAAGCSGVFAARKDSGVQDPSDSSFLPACWSWPELLPCPTVFAGSPGPVLPPSRG